MKQIIAMGGGGFSMEPDHLVLDQFIINQSKQPSPRNLFSAYGKRGCRELCPAVLSCFSTA